jgi:hypothetical protein
MLFDQLNYYLDLIGHLYYDMLEDTKRVIRGRKSKDTQYNDRRKNDKKTNNDLEYTT